jgi:hypothetical protein
VLFHGLALAGGKGGFSKQQVSQDFALECLRILNYLLCRHEKNARIAFGYAGKHFLGGLRDLHHDRQRPEMATCVTARNSPPLINLNSYPRLLLPSLLITMLKNL